MDLFFLKRGLCCCTSLSLLCINKIKTCERCRIHYIFLALEITECTAPGLFTAASASININVKWSPHIPLLLHPSPSLSVSLTLPLSVTPPVLFVCRTNTKTLPLFIHFMIQIPESESNRDESF